MTEERRRERDLILAPNEYAFILDETKGNVINYVGPHKTSLANTEQKRLEARLAEQEPLDKINEAELARQRAARELELEIVRRRLEQRLEEFRAEVEALVNKANAVSPQLVSALQAFSDKALTEKMAASMAPLSIG